MIFEIPTFTLDTMGRVQSVTDFGGRTVSMTYDHMGRTVTRTMANATVSNADDAVGNLTSVTDERGKVTTYSYFQGAWPNTTVDPVGKRVVPPLWRAFPTTPQQRPCHNRGL